MKTVLITTSGTGERLGIFTKYTNKSLVNVGDKYAICYIIENYEQNTEFIITIGYYGNLVKDFLLLAYPTRNFTFLEIDNYVGDGSSLGYSLLQAKIYLQKPFIFHCCDAIITKPVYFDETKNALCVAKHSSSKHYANIKVRDDIVQSINSKNYVDFDYVYTGISFIYNYSNFWENLEMIYNSNKFNSNLSDVDSIRLMLNNNIFTYNVLDNWYDTGNKDSYDNLQKYFVSSYNIIAKPTESLCFFDKTVVKFINDKTINTKRIIRGSHLANMSPKLLNYADNFILMEKIEGTVLSKYYKHGEIYKLLTWAKHNLWKNKNQNQIYIKECYDFYIHKTNNRIKTIKWLSQCNSDFSEEINIINGVNTGTIETLMNKIVSFNNLFTDTFYNFHGDFILDNIIKTNDTYVLIDWRHEFGTQLQYGDIYYDLAKLRHNIIFNHENILNDLYELAYHNDEITLDLKCNYFFMQQLNDFDKFVMENNFDLKKIKIIMAIIWLNMSPLYDTKLSKFLFYLGKYNLALII